MKKLLIAFFAAVITFDSNGLCNIEGDPNLLQLMPYHRQTFSGATKDSTVILNKKCDWMAHVTAGPEGERIVADRVTTLCDEGKVVVKRIGGPDELVSIEPSGNNFVVMTPQETLLTRNDRARQIGPALNADLVMVTVAVHKGEVAFWDRNRVEPVFISAEKNNALISHPSASTSFRAESIARLSPGQLAKGSSLKRLEIYIPSALSAAEALFEVSTGKPTHGLKPISDTDPEMVL